jgi:bacillithiol biosynthesis cysteine-adding enzyme BshC
MTVAARSRVITEPLGGSALSLAIQSRRLPPDVQCWWPSSVDEWKEHAIRVRSGANANWYDQVRAAIAPHGLAAKRLDLVASEGGIVVTTGQQAGLFGGPLYTVAKALTALALADALEEELGFPVAPVFWAASDDADFLEASITHVADADGLHELKLEDAPLAGTPMSIAPLGNMHPLLERLRKACGSAAHAVYYEFTRVAYTQERTVGDAYVRMLRDLLAPLGIAVMDSSHPAYRQASRAVLTKALQRAPEIAGAVAERVAAIRKLGFEPQVEDERGLSLVYTVEKGVKRRIPIDEAPSFLASDTSEAILGPNVLLRPVVERELFPTAGYVAGPAELAYFTQSNAVATALGRNRVVGVPRWSCTVVEPFAEKALRRLRVQYHEVRDLAALERRLATAALPPRVADAWRRLQDQMRSSVRELGEAVRETSLMPPEVAEGLERSLGHKLARAERRLLAAVKRREDNVRRDLAVARAALFPLGERQERVLNYVPMLTRGGPDLVKDMRAAAHKHALSLVRAEHAEAFAAR